MHSISFLFWSSIQYYFFLLDNGFKYEANRCRYLRTLQQKSPIQNKLIDRILIQYGNRTE
jgi:hypothetical protein